MHDQEYRLPVVGIGASAGGLEALIALVSELRPGAGAAYVIVQHLSPDQPSMLAELLAAKCRLPVETVAEGGPVAPDTVWVVPAGTVARLEGDRLRLTPRDAAQKPPHPIDSFFDSLAAARGPDAYCVVLSGTGNDGAEGLKKIKAAGGFALVQTSSGARFPGMPDSAVATGQVDIVLPADRIADQLWDLLHHHRALDEDEIWAGLRRAIEERLPRITARLTEVSGNDFSEYKPGTLLRRVERRMALLKMRSTEAFVERLERDDREASILARDFLIGVTSFFRDPKAFEVLRETVVAPLVRDADRAIRVWVPGCSTGEEAYSIAMLFQEEMETQGRRLGLQVFGTDIDTGSLVQARHALFAGPALDGLSPERRARFFLPEAGQYRAAPSLREACVFAPHNVAQDPPFSRLDLISCRNLLIYLSAELQRKVLPRFHFGLRGEGHLFLGPAENATCADGLFFQVDKASRLFRRNPEAQPGYSALGDPMLRPNFHRAPPRVGGAADMGQVPRQTTREALAEREFLAYHAPAFALVSADGQTSHLSARIGRFVQPSAGAPPDRIDQLLAPSLRLAVRTALRRAVTSGATVEQPDLPVEIEGAAGLVDLRVAPVRSEEGQFMVVLSGPRARGAVELGHALKRRDTSERETLESENFELRRTLTETLHESDTSGQELKSSNEELLSMNEELQSSNEELETSREELQSINEELETVNAELQENNRQLIRANSDLKNLFESTSVALLFLDRFFCLRNYTPVTTDLFQVKPRDIGRPLWDIASRIDYSALKEEAERVDHDLRPIEREVRIGDTNETYLMRMKPYRTTENVIDGFVLSFVDISARKRYEETLERQRAVLARQYAELENLYDTTPVGLALLDRGHRYTRINERLAQINGVPAEAHIGLRGSDLLPEIGGTVAPVIEAVFETGEARIGLEVSGPTAANDERRHYLVDYYPIRDQGYVFAVGCCVQDVTEQVRARHQIERQTEQQALLLAELQHRVKNTLATIRAISRTLLTEDMDARAYQARLARPLEALARTHDLLTERDWAHVALADLVVAEARPFQGEQASRIRLSGDPLVITSKQAIPLGMALHELMTNAAKYGALSVEAGHVDIAATVVEDCVTIDWREIGGPPVAPPKRDRTGFGTMVLDRVLRTDLDARVTMTYPPEGLTFRIVFDREKQ
jgi:two-component system CheB/CheR fusion protein